MTGGECTNIHIDEKGPIAQEAAELARRLVSARLIPVPAAWTTETEVILEALRDEPALHAAFVMALANLARLALTGWAGSLDGDERSPTAEHLLDHLAGVCNRLDWTI